MINHAVERATGCAAPPRLMPDSSGVLHGVPDYRDERGATDEPERIRLTGHALRRCDLPSWQQQKQIARIVVLLVDHRIPLGTWRDAVHIPVPLALTSDRIDPHAPFPTLDHPVVSIRSAARPEVPRLDVANRDPPIRLSLDPEAPVTDAATHKLDELHTLPDRSILQGDDERQGAGQIGMPQKRRTETVQTGCAELCGGGQQGIGTRVRWPQRRRPINPYRRVQPVCQHPVVCPERLGQQHGAYLLSDSALVRLRIRQRRADHCVHFWPLSDPIPDRGGGVEPAAPLDGALQNIPCGVEDVLCRFALFAREHPAG